MQKKASFDLMKISLQDFHLQAYSLSNIGNVKMWREPRTQRLANGEEISVVSSILIKNKYARLIIAYLRENYENDFTDKNPNDA